jgi:hypothetical protein
MTARIPRLCSGYIVVGRMGLRSDIPPPRRGRLEKLMMVRMGADQEMDILPEILYFLYFLYFF